jgi:hypothetical protein
VYGCNFDVAEGTKDMGLEEVWPGIEKGFE